jgi:hypothetical protein
MTGYSVTPLWKKLGIKSGMCVCVPNAPPEYITWISPVPDGASVVRNAARGACDIVHIFVDSQAALDRELKKARVFIHDDGAIWVSWPKKSAGVRTELDENRIRAAALQTDLVDVKVCAVSEVWSGLKLVVRTHLRARTRRNPQRPTARISN